LRAPRDGGLTWTSTAVTGVSAFAFVPSIAVDAHGTVGDDVYDLRNDRPGDAALTADAWFAGSHDRGDTWQQTHVAGRFDMRGLPSSGNGHQLGEYQGWRRSAPAASRRSSPRRRRWPRTARPTSSSPTSTGHSRARSIATR
jgi:hypothetical protein